MQFTQPGFTNYGQPFAFNTPFQFNGYPEVVGEGNVTSVMSPDGSMQLLFLPTTQWWRPYPCNLTNGNVNNPNWNPTGAWFIRSVFSPDGCSACLAGNVLNGLANVLLQTMPCQPQPYHTPSGIGFPRTYSSDCFVNQPVTCPPPNFELKFHNDICTSTSDMHYFYPSLRTCEWLRKPTGYASVQVDVPMVTNSACHYEVICTKPCNCTRMDETEKPEKAKCTCEKMSDTSFSDMSCETEKSEKECCCNKGKGNKKTRKEKKKCKPKKKTSSKVICECKEQKNTDKCVTTVADQASGCAAEKGRETQTSRGTIPVRKVRSGGACKNQAKVEFWTPKTPASKKAVKIKSSENFAGVCESGCCSSTSTCSCHSDID